MERKFCPANVSRRRFLKSSLALPAGVALTNRASAAGGPTDIGRNNWFKGMYRKVHIDFHVPDWALDVASGFDGSRNAELLHAAGVQAVSYCAKDLYGNVEYFTKLSNRHPHLKSDYFGLMTQALKKRGIKTVAYYNVGADVRTTRVRSEWAALGKDGRQMGGWWRDRESDAGGTPCVLSPYTEETILLQLAEITRNYDPDAFFLDMVHWEIRRPCYCSYCKQAYRKATGR